MRTRTLENVLRDISSTYNINFDELVERYCNHVRKYKKNNEDCIEAQEFVYNDLQYYIDKNNILYQITSDGICIAGKRHPDGSVLVL